MGQYLATGLVTELRVSKKEVEQAKIGMDELVDKMSIRLRFNPAIYTLQNENEYFAFYLKDEILRKELIPFLEKLYPALYNLNEYADFPAVLAKLKSIEPEHWLRIAKEKKYAAFQFDPYGMPGYLDAPFGNVIKISYCSVILSMEGKVIMDGCGGQFAFFQYCIAQAFAEFALSGATRVYITG
jgi:hypothetical protein